MEWISVKDQMPADGGRILVAVLGTDDEGMRVESGVCFAIYRKRRFLVLMDDEPSQEFTPYVFRGTSTYTLWGMKYTITHWMPLPELPEDVSK